MNLTSTGKTDITTMMLDAGAETDLVNSVGRTAAQMAAFVGQNINKQTHEKNSPVPTPNPMSKESSLN